MYINKYERVPIFKPYFKMFISLVNFNNLESTL